MDKIVLRKAQVIPKKFVYLQRNDEKRYTPRNLSAQTL